MLGFQGDADLEGGVLYLDMTDEEENPSAPLCFTVTLLPQSKDRQREYEENGIDSGVFVEQMYGMGPDHLATWAAWDRYLTNMMGGPWEDPQGVPSPSGEGDCA